MNILILRVSSIGDVIHTLPAIFLIKKSCPQAKISWVVQKKVASILLNQPFLQKVWILPDNFLYPKNWNPTLKILKEIRLVKWSAILDFQGIVKTSILSLFLKGTKYGFDSKNSKVGFTSFFNSKHIIPIYTNIIQKNLALASQMLLQEKINTSQCLSISKLKNYFQLNFTKQNKLEVEFWLKKKKINKFIILAPNTTWPSKHWPQNNWQTLLKMLSKNNIAKSFYSFVLVGKDFGDQSKNLARYIKEKNLNIYLAPKWNLLSICYLVSKSSLIVAPDTGLLHIADFLEKNAIGIFGPTLAKKHGPFIFTQNIKNAIQIKCPHLYKKNHSSIWKNNKKTGTKTNCMYKLSPEMLYKEILNFLNG
ncbi:hypothetical protein KAT08_04595 [Candidatus Babeliales bacterium]|nr:hypothetical protein [Candidatus Babeliales bacterium]